MSMYNFLFLMKFSEYLKYYSTLKVLIKYLIYYRNYIKRRNFANFDFSSSKKRFPFIIFHKHIFIKKIKIFRYKITFK